MCTFCDFGSNSIEPGAICYTEYPSSSSSQTSCLVNQQQQQQPKKLLILFMLHSYRTVLLCHVIQYVVFCLDYIRKHEVFATHRNYLPKKKRKEKIVKTTTDGKETSLLKKLWKQSKLLMLNYCVLCRETRLLSTRRIFFDFFHLKIIENHWCMNERIGCTFMY